MELIPEMCSDCPLVTPQLALDASGFPQNVQILLGFVGQWATPKAQDPRND